MPAPHVTFTRAGLTAALAAVDRADLADGMYAIRCDPWEARRTAPTALAFDYETPADLAVFTVVVAGLLGTDDGIDFAAATQHGLPAHPERTHTVAGGAYWPGWVLDELTGEQWQDEINHCLTCRALEPVDGGRCTPHARAPWDPAPAVLELDDVEPTADPVPVA
jgi:hypothetical protein